jgi:hypothetical protein
VLNSHIKLVLLSWVAKVISVFWEGKLGRQGPWPTRSDKQKVLDTD